MKECVWRLCCLVVATVLLAGCGDRTTRDALQKAADLQAQQQYQDANSVLVDAIRLREEKLHTSSGAANDSAGFDDLLKKVKSDPDILKLERAQIPIYLKLERSDLAAVVYADILSGDPNDTIMDKELRDKDPAIRTGAVRILGLRASAASIPDLATAARDSDQEVRRAAMNALGAIKDPKVVPILVAGLKDSYWFTRTEAANSLAQEHDPKTIAPLLDAAGDTDAQASAAAQTTLTALCREPGASADDFAARLDDPNPKIAVTSVMCLAAMKDPRAVPVLEKLVTDENPTVRLDAVQGLGETGDPSVIPTLRLTLKDPDMNMRGWSIIGLGRLRDATSLPDLRAIADDSTQPSSIRAAAAAAADAIASTMPKPPPVAPPGTLLPATNGPSAIPSLPAGLSNTPKLTP